MLQATPGAAERATMHMQAPMLTCPCAYERTRPDAARGHGQAQRGCLPAQHAAQQQQHSTGCHSIHRRHACCPCGRADGTIRLCANTTIVYMPSTRPKSPAQHSPTRSLMPAEPLQVSQCYAGVCHTQDPRESSASVRLLPLHCRMDSTSTEKYIPTHINMPSPWIHRLAAAGACCHTTCASRPASDQQLHKLC
jgi:hypothetical protein